MTRVYSCTCSKKHLAYWIDKSAVVNQPKNSLIVYLLYKIKSYRSQEKLLDPHNSYNDTKIERFGN